MPHDFYAVEWIKVAFPHAHLSTGVQNAVFNFSLIWNVFEGQFCGGGVTIRRLEAVSGSVFRPAQNDDALSKTLRFYKNRYIENGNFNWRFGNLNFRKNDRRQFVETVLLDHDQNSQDAILALLIIIYRLRNNLFHGLKAFDLLGDQEDNLNTAARFLTVVMERLREPAH